MKMIQEKLLLPIIPSRYRALLEPLSTDAPCGDDLEYHPDLMVAQTRVARQESAQYGQFVAPQEAVNWREIETSVLSLLDKGRDIRALLLFLRCRIQMGGAEGAYQGFWLLAELLHRYPDAIHPKRVIDGEADPFLQANALALLSDSHSVLADLKDVVVDGSSATYLTLRDIERSLAIPRPTDARELESIEAQLKALHDRNQPAMAALVGCQVQIARIVAWTDLMLNGDAPDLTILTRVFQVFDRYAPHLVSDRATTQEVKPPAATVPLPAGKPAASPALSQFPGDVALARNEQSPVHAADGKLREKGLPTTNDELPGAVADRAQALAYVQAARRWFEFAEPSSPVADLLRQAERLTGKRYAEIADAIPLDLLTRWREAN